MRQGMDAQRDRYGAAAVRIVAFDPGFNVGVAWLAEDGGVLNLAIVKADELAGLAVPEGAHVLVGDGTGHAEVLRALRRRGLEPVLVDERDTTLEARQLYFRDHPARGFARWLPLGMRSPERSIDDYAALAIALRWRSRVAGPEG